MFSPCAGRPSFWSAFWMRDLFTLCGKNGPMRVLFTLCEKKGTHESSVHPVWKKWTHESSVHPVWKMRWEFCLPLCENVHPREFYSPCVKKNGPLRIMFAPLWKKKNAPRRVMFSSLWKQWTLQNSVHLSVKQKWTQQSSVHLSVKEMYVGELCSLLCE